MWVCDEACVSPVIALLVLALRKWKRNCEDGWRAPELLSYKFKKIDILQIYFVLFPWYSKKKLLMLSITVVIFFVFDNVIRMENLILWIYTYYKCALKWLNCGHFFFFANFGIFHFHPSRLKSNFKRTNMEQNGRNRISQCWKWYTSHLVTQDDSTVLDRPPLPKFIQNCMNYFYTYFHVCCFLDMYLQYCSFLWSTMLTPWHFNRMILQYPYRHVFVLHGTKAYLKNITRI